MAHIEGKIDAQMAAKAERDEILAQSAAKSAGKAVNVTTPIWLAAVSVVLGVVGTFYATQSSTPGITQTTLAPGIPLGFARFRFFSMLRNEIGCTVWFTAALQQTHPRSVPFLKWLFE